MREAPFVCLFCGTKQGLFRHVEHPIPESMGNDDTILPKGFVCDGCNQYFGSKLEQQIMASPPFNVERVAAAVKTKNRKYAKYESRGASFFSTGFWDHAIFSFDPDQFNAILDGAKGYLFMESPRDYATLLARFLIKVGLELLVLAETEDPYSTKYDKARSYCRYGNSAVSWQVAYGTYPKREDLVVAKHCDEIGPLETRQIYEYSIGCTQEEDRVIFFAFINHCFACNLSNPTIGKYLEQFNKMNKFEMRLVKRLE